MAADQHLACDLPVPVRLEGFGITRRPQEYESQNTDSRWDVYASVPQYGLVRNVYSGGLGPTVTAGAWPAFVGPLFHGVYDIVQASLAHRQLIFSFPPISRPNIFVYKTMSPDEILAGLQGSFVAMDSVNPLDQILSQVNELCNPRQQTEDTPTVAACESARRILAEVQRITPITLGATAVEASEGDLLIHWDTPSRSIVLICPKDGTAPSIYRETLGGTAPTSSHLLRNASAQSLSEALTWVLPPPR